MEIVQPAMAGALDCTIKARVEGALFRSVGQFDHLPWGGAVR